MSLTASATHALYTTVTSAALALCSFGCASVAGLPEPIETHTSSNETVFAFDLDGDTRPDFWQFQQSDGRKHALAYASAKSGQPDQRVDLDALDPTECPHLLIALDGVPFELVSQLYRAGHFRFFHPPARVICCYPAMTDLALNELFQTGPSLAYQARYFERDANRFTSGNAVYLSGRNSPWLAKMAYRCSFWWDAKAYLEPQAVFDHELRGIARAFSTVDTGEAYAYSVGTAGLGTRGGQEAILEYLRTLDRFCERIVYERRGRVKLTLVADHGHNLVPNRRISFRETLEAGGYRQTKSLRDPRDVVCVSYGLVTYAAFFTDDPAGVATCLLNHDDVEFACYPAADAIVVRSREGTARITRRADDFAYDSRAGDPLRLNLIVERLRREGKVSPDNAIDENALFDATVHHDYPDPLARLWGAFHAVVQDPPDLIVNLRDGACHGSRFFHVMIGKVSSTHGSLNAANSTTFAMTMLGELPPALRSRKVLPALERLRSGTSALDPLEHRPSAVTTRCRPGSRP